MKTSEKGIKLIKEFEGCYLKAYQDSVGVWTIGWGITNADKAITGKTIKKGLTIDQPTAEKWLKASLEKIYEPKVMKYYDKYKWNQNQFDALISFAFNIGSIDQLTANGTRSIETIAAKMLEYCKAGGKKLTGLVRRRKAEHALFCTPVEKKGYPGSYPKLPSRGYFKEGDGYTRLSDWRSEIIKVQTILNWATGSKLRKDGKYGQKTADVVFGLQDDHGLPMNGCFGKKCIAVIRSMKK